MSRGGPHERFHAEPVYDVHDCGAGRHDRYISGWDVVNSEGIYAAGPFESEPDAAEEAERLNRMHERPANCTIT